MLVLSRKVGQEILVGDNVRITVTKVSGNRVTLGIEAPDHVRILRGELEPVVCSFEDGFEEKPAPEVKRQPDVLAQTVALVDDVVKTVPFVPSAAR